MEKVMLYLIFVTKKTPNRESSSPFSFLISTCIWWNFTKIKYLSFILSVGWFLEQVVEVSTSKTGKHGHAKCHFVGIDIFNGKKLEDIVPSSHNCDVSVLSYIHTAGILFLGFQWCVRKLSYIISNFLCSLLVQVPHVTRTDYQLIDISEDGFVSDLLCETLYWVHKFLVLYTLHEWFQVEYSQQFMGLYRVKYVNVFWWTMPLDWYMT